MVVTAATQFGEEYVLHGSPQASSPHLSEGAASIHATVTYTSACEGGGSAFEAHKIEKDDMDGSMAVYVLRRLAESCPPERAQQPPQQVTTAVAAKVQGAVDPTAMTFIAFPPDQEYELFTLSERAGVVWEGEGGDAAEVEADASVQLSASTAGAAAAANDTGSAEEATPAPAQATVPGITVEASA